MDGERMKKIIFTILSIFWMILIFAFSAEPADESSQLSLSVGQAVAEIFVPEYEGWPEDRQQEFVESIEYPIRKCAHASEYAVLGILLMLAGKNYLADRKRIVTISGMIGVIYAASDEFHQSFVPGRACKITDVMIDSLGLAVGIFLAYIIWSNSSDMQK